MTQFHPVSEDRFLDALTRALPLEERGRPGRTVSEQITVRRSYSDARCYLGGDHLSGYAITDAFELVSAFNVSTSPRGHALVAEAVANGALSLDCYDEDDRLPSLYRAHGFVEVDRIPWDDAYRPVSWRGGKPDVVFLQVSWLR